MRMDDGGIDPGSHIHVATASVQSTVTSEVLSVCKRHATAVSPQSPSDVGKMIASAASMSHNSSAPVPICKSTICTSA